MLLAALVCTFAAGFLIGWQRSIIVELSSRQPEEPVAGATVGSYGPINEYMVNQPDKETGLVMPKTPQQLEWEEEQQLRKAQEPK